MLPYVTEICHIIEVTNTSDIYIYIYIKGLISRPVHIVAKNRQLASSYPSVRLTACGLPLDRFP